MLDFITVADLEDFMGTDLDAGRADFAVRVGQTVVRKYMQQELTFHQDDIEYHDGTGKSRIRLRERPVRQVTSVAVDDEELEPDDWKIRKAILIRKNNIAFLPGQEVTVTYDHGWDVIPSSDEEEPFPADIQRVALAVARRALSGEGASDEIGGTDKSETIGSYSYRISTGNTGQTITVGGQLSDNEMEILDSYIIRLQV